MRNHGLRAVALALALLAAAPCAAQAGWKSRMHWRGGSWLMHAHDDGGRSVPAGEGANWVVFDPATRTLYVPNYFDDTISVIDPRSGPVATLPAGNGPGAITLDPRTRTLYGVNLEDGTVSAYDAANCNAQRTTACGGARASAAVGGVPIGLAIDEATDTVYVTFDGADTTALLDGTTCNRAVSSGCAVAARAATGTVAIPFADQTSRTIYLPGADANQVVVLNARTCNARATGGCGGPFPAATAGAGSFTGAADPSTRTVYIANAEDATVTVIDGSRCNGSVSSGCGDAAPVTPVGPEPNAGVAIDPGTHTMYVISASQDLLSVADTAHCRAGDSSGCDREWPTLRTGGEPFWADLDPRTHTVYTANFRDGTVSVLDGGACNAVRRDGCRRVAPVIATGTVVEEMAINRKVHTVYVTDSLNHHLTLVDSARCSGARPDRCSVRVEPVPGVSGPADIALDEDTQTIYVTNQDDRNVVLIDPRTCNVSRRGGCAPAGAPIPIPDHPLGVATDPRSHAVYVTGIDSERLYRIDGAHCRIGDRSRCTPVSGSVGEDPLAIATDPATGTVYTANASGSVSVVDDRACCAAKASVTVGHQPRDLAFDPGTRRLYVTNFGDDGDPGTVSVIDTRVCNARMLSGCGQAPGTLATGRGPLGITVDPDSHVVYTAGVFRASVSALDGRSAPRDLDTAFIPLRVLLDAPARTLYVSSLFQTLQVVPVG